MADGDEFTPWTAEGADRLRFAAREAAAALIQHADTVAALGEIDFPEILASSGRLVPILRALSDAQFDYTGNAGPFGRLEGWDDMEGEDDPGEQPQGTGITILQRSDYRLTDEDAVIEAGRSAYSAVWPSKTPEDAAADVTNLGRALYQIAHRTGSWSTVDTVNGLEIAGRVVLTVSNDLTLGSEPGDWPESLFQYDDGQVIYRQDDAFLY